MSLGHRPVRRRPAHRGRAHRAAAAAPVPPDDVDAVYRASPGRRDPALDRPAPGALHARGRPEFVEDIAMTERERPDRALGASSRPTASWSAPAGIYLRGGPARARRSATRSRPGPAGRATRPRRRTALAQWGLGLGAPRVHLFVDVGNTASQAIARAGGLHRGGHRPVVPGLPGRIAGRRGALRAAGRGLTRAAREGAAHRALPPPVRRGAAPCATGCAACAGPVPFCGTSVSRMRP